MSNPAPVIYRHSMTFEYCYVPYNQHSLILCKDCMQDDVMEPVSASIEPISTYDRCCIEIVLEVKESVSVDADATTELFHRVLTAGLRDGLDVVELAKMCGVEPSYFEDAFAMRYGMSPQRWFEEQRLRIARSIGSVSALSVVVLARLCGFKNVSYFVSRYRRRYGVTPSSNNTRLDGRGGVIPAKIEVRIGDM